jgi:hypothetical protein
VQCNALRIEISVELHRREVSRSECRITSRAKQMANSRPGEDFWRTSFE